ASGHCHRAGGGAGHAELHAADPAALAGGLHRAVRRAAPAARATRAGAAARGPARAPAGRIAAAVFAGNGIYLLAAFLVTALFLVVYVSRALLLPTKFFPGEGLLRTIYFLILGSHTILAVAVGPLALVVLYRAFKGDFKRHRKLARITLPIWLYVVVTGWAI